METILFSLAQAQFKPSAYTLEACDNLGCRTMPCCPQDTFSSTYFSCLLFFPFQRVKCKLITSHSIRISSWVQYLSQLYVTELNGPWDP